LVSVSKNQTGMGVGFLELEIGTRSKTGSDSGTIIETSSINSHKMGHGSKTRTRIFGQKKSL